MSPSLWVALILIIVALCWIVGVYIEIARNEIDDTQAKADMEAMLKSDEPRITRNRIRAGVEND